MRRDDPRHGTYNGYNNLGCRCPECRIANAKYQRELSHRVGRNVPRDVWLERVKGKSQQAHGTEGRYVFGCRCDECRRASRDARRRRRSAA